MKYLVFVIIFLEASYAEAIAQRIARLEVRLRNNPGDISVPVKVDLDKMSFQPASNLVLLEINGNKRIPVPSQVSEGEVRTLSWIITPTGGSAAKREFELQEGTPQNFPEVTAGLKDGALTIHDGDKNLLQYRYGTVYPPTGVDTVFKRSGFIHPLWTPHGQSLTRIQAPDHYHHYGIWNPWTHVLIGKDTIDFWNLAEKQGTVRFGNFVAVNNGPVYAEYKALHQHVMFRNGGGGEKIAMNELQTVRVYKPQPEQDYYHLDLTIALNCASEQPVRILEYRYAGLGWRATEKWNKDNSEVLTSEGKNRKEADGTTGRWFIVQGALDNDYGGAVMMSYPANYNHPEPMRIWPEDANRVGEMFAMFAPTKNKDWLLLPGRTYTLKYRMVVFNGHFTKEAAESAWQNYAEPPMVTIEK